MNSIYPEICEITESILNALRNSDYAAFDKIYIAYYKPLKDFLGLLTKSEDDAEDITQQVFITLWEKREHINPKKSIRGFLYTTARNMTLNHFSHKKVEDKYLQLQGRATDIDDSPYEIMLGKELELLIRVTIQKMPTQRRKIMTMKLDECKSNEDIARELDLSPETVKGHITKGKKDIDSVIRLFLILFILS